MPQKRRLPILTWTIILFPLGKRQIFKGSYRLKKIFLLPHEILIKQSTFQPWQIYNFLLSSYLFPGLLEKIKNLIQVAPVNEVPNSRKHCQTSSWTQNLKQQLLRTRCLTSKGKENDFLRVKHERTKEFQPFRDPRQKRKKNRRCRVQDISG